VIVEGKSKVALERKRIRMANTKEVVPRDVARRDAMGRGVIQAMIPRKIDEDN
jgi:hypothetical protein